MALKGEQVFFASGSFGNYSVQIKGLKSLLDWLKTADPKLEKAMKKSVRESSAPVLQKARANASSLADDGTYAGSLSIGTKSAKGAFQVLLKSSDEAAGVKEFAGRGARTVTSKGTPLADARLRKHSGVGVPRRANAPRAMVPAVNDSADEVQTRMEAAIKAILDEVGR